MRQHPTTERLPRRAVASERRGEGSVPISGGAAAGAEPRAFLDAGVDILGTGISTDSAAFNRRCAQFSGE